MDPQSTQSVQKQITDLLLKNQKILIMASSPADGDCIGSSLALYLTLKKLNKEVTVVCPDPIPDVYHFLPTTHVIGDRVVASKDFIITIDTKKIQSAQVKDILEDGKINIIIMPENGRLSEEDVSFNYGPERYDLIVTVDTGGVEQLGKLYSNNVEMFHQIPVINIDHHFSNDHFGKLNYVDVMSSATTELITPLISMLEAQSGKELWDEDIATLLLTGIITDTGSFQNANTTPRAFDASAQLISHGARQQEIIQHIFKTKQLTTLKLWGRILTKMQTDDTYHIVWSVLTKKDFADTGASENETGGIIDELLSNAPGAEIICLLKEKKEGIVSGSIRTTNPSVDAALMAESFGGGGHTRAAGFKIANMPIEKVESDVLKKFREYQGRRLGIATEGQESIAQPDIKNTSNSPFISLTKQKMENTNPAVPQVPVAPPAPEVPAVIPEAPLPVVQEAVPLPVPVAAPEVPAVLPVVTEAPKIEMPLEVQPMAETPVTAPEPVEPAVEPAPAPAPVAVPMPAAPVQTPAPVVVPEPQVSQPAPSPMPVEQPVAPSPFNFQTPVAESPLPAPVAPQSAEATVQPPVPEVQPPAPYQFEK